uniref:Putative aldehyde dehydrogenase isoform X2 n=1 Tax=Rhizophora mucronata TaxID=61149 RepID=A0A2P2LB32_RHIMU
MYKFLGCREMRARAPQQAIAWLASFNLSRRSTHSLPFSTVEVEEISGSQSAEVHNLGTGSISAAFIT